MFIRRLVISGLLLLLTACSDKTELSTVNFVPMYANKLVQCGQALAIGGSNWQIEQLQFFVSEVQLQDNNGEWHSVSMITTPMQAKGVALLGVNCQDENRGYWKFSFEQNKLLTDYQKIRFSLGVPFELNHQNPIKQISPLNISSMFWVWQTGHKFLRLEMQSDTEHWLFHLGSTGCKSPSVMRAPNNACRYPNLFRVEVPLNDENLILDLDALISELELSEQNNCQSEADKPSCHQLMSKLRSAAEYGIFKGVKLE